MPLAPGSELPRFLATGLLVGLAVAGRAADPGHASISPFLGLHTHGACSGGRGHCGQSKALWPSWPSPGPPQGARPSQPALLAQLRQVARPITHTTQAATPSVRGAAQQPRSMAAAEPCGTLGMPSTPARPPKTVAGYLTNYCTQAPGPAGHGHHGEHGLAGCSPAATTFGLDNDRRNGLPREWLTLLVALFPSFTRQGPRC